MKVESVRQLWNKGQQHLLPPVLVSEIDGELALIICSMGERTKIYFNGFQEFIRH